MVKLLQNTVKGWYIPFLALFILMSAGPVNGQRLMTDNFEYSVGDLYNQGNWWKYGSNPEAPIQVIDEALTYPGYQDAAIGKAVKLTDTATGEDLQKKFTVGDESIKSGSLYASTLVNIQDIQNKSVNYVMAFVAKFASSSISDGKTGTEYGRLFVKASGNEGKFFFGVSRGGATPIYGTTEYSFSTTYLVILKYEFIDGTTNDKVSIFINPESTTTEPTTPEAIYETGSDGEASANGIQAIELRQGTTSSKVTPNMIFDALRISTNYASIFDAGTVVVTPTITTSTKNAYFNNSFIGETYTQKVIVKAKDLNGEITIGGMTSGELSVPVTTISKEDAESEAGYELEIRFTPTSEDTYTDVITLDSEGAAQQKITAYWSSKTLEKVATLADLAAKNIEDYGTYKYTGEAVITFINDKSYYIQDASGAMRLFDNYGDITTPLAVGDKISGFMCSLGSSFGIYAMPESGTSITKVAEGQSVTPATVTLATLAATPAKYFNQLIKIEKIKFTEGVGELFENGMTPLAISDATGEGTMKLFKGTDIAETTVPAVEFDITGISSSSSAAIIAPRKLADMDIPKEPEALTVTPEMIFEGTAAPLNVATQYVKLKIKATALAAPVTVSLSGTNRSMFSLSSEEIAAGSSDTEIIVTYTPTTIAKHTARINFEATNPELNTAYTINSVCIDPQNPPTVTIKSSELTAFNAKVGEQSQQTITVTTANLPDYGSIKVMGEGEGSFLIGSTMLMKNATDAKVVITFKPKAEGTFTERLQFSALEAETQYVTVTGTTTGGADIEVPEGDKLPLSTENPYKVLNEKFDGVEKNKALSITDWKNVAVDGTRAWWGYEFAAEDGSEKAAKVTPYDSKVVAGKESPCEMLLVTPPLDFKNSATKMFTFRVMGDYLIDGQTDQLEVCYIDMLDNEMYINPIEIDIPNIPDNNKEWREFHVNLEGQNIADVFFIGFRFKSTRGLTNSATYYIDDVSYGRTDLPIITPSVASVAFEALAGKDYTSDEITITTKNTTEPITLTIGGANKSKFKVSEATLPAEGGKFKVLFNSDNIGVHEAYVKVSSRGAADIYIPISVNNKKTDGVETINFSETPDVIVTDLMGRIVKEVKKCTSRAQLEDGLLSGYYITVSTSATTTRTTKIMIP